MEEVKFTDPHLFMYSYGQEVLAEFSGPCWMAVTDKRDSLAALSQVDHNSFN